MKEDCLLGVLLWVEEFMAAVWREVPSLLLEEMRRVLRLYWAFSLLVLDMLFSDALMEKAVLHHGA